MDKYDIYILAADANRTAATALYEGMKKYRLPKGVKPGNSLDSHSIFLDTDEKPFDAVTASLLDSAGYLVVLFSPQARASMSLMDKLFYFEKVTGRENIVPVIAEGEPVDIFPDMFIQHRRVKHILPDMTIFEMDETIEPVAADVRGSTPKRRREALRYETVRITASVLDIHPDALEQRHRKRRNRTIALFAGTASAVLLVIAVIFSVLGVRAYREGLIAEKQALLATQTVDRLTEELPEEFSDYPEALEAVEDAVERAETALGEQVLEERGS